jgi:hypothetical protein
MPSTFGGFGGSLQFRYAHFNIFKLNSLHGTVEYTLGRTEFDCGGHIGIGHKLQNNGAGSTSRLLHPGDRLLDRFPAGVPILFDKLRDLKPPQ